MSTVSWPLSHLSRPRSALTHKTLSNISPSELTAWLGCLDSVMTSKGDIFQNVLTLHRAIESSSWNLQLSEENWNLISTVLYHVTTDASLVVQLMYILLKISLRFLNKSHTHYPMTTKYTNFSHKIWLSQPSVWPHYLQVQVVPRCLSQTRKVLRLLKRQERHHQHTCISPTRSDRLEVNILAIEITRIKWTATNKHREKRVWGTLTTRRLKAGPPWGYFSHLWS